MICPPGFTKSAIGRCSPPCRPGYVQAGEFCSPQ